MKKNSRLVKDNRKSIVGKIIEFRPKLAHINMGLPMMIKHERNHILNKANNIKYGRSN